MLPKPRSTDQNSKVHGDAWLQQIRGAEQASLSLAGAPQRLDLRGTFRGGGGTRGAGGGGSQVGVPAPLLGGKPHFTHEPQDHCLHPQPSHKSCTILGSHM